MITRILISAAILFSSTTTFAQEATEEELIGSEIKKAVKSLEKKNLPLSFEARKTDTNFKTGEFIFRYKNFSVDYLRMSEKYPTESYIKLGMENKIISLMGTGAFWSYGLCGDAEKNYFVPTAGIGLYMAIMPKTKIYLQFSGIFLGGFGHSHDFEAGINYAPSKHFSMSAGFRSINFDFNRKENGDFKMTSPFIGLRSDF